MNGPYSLHGHRVPALTCHSLALKGCLLYLLSKDSKCFSLYGTLMSLALDSSICDICCSRAGREKTSKQCSEFLLTHFGFGFMCITEICAREEALSFSTQRPKKKVFLSPLTILQFCWHHINLTFIFQTLPLVPVLGVKGQQGFVLQVPISFHLLKCIKEQASFPWSYQAALP